MRTAKIENTGQFTDKTGVKHDWKINSAHALLWDGKPYLPVGGAFTPRSFGDDGETAWQYDTRALDMLKARGVQDVLIWPGKPLPDIPVKAAQRLIDYLDANGFHYGISWGPGLTQMASGSVVKPSVYRKDVRPNIHNDAALTAEWIASSADRGTIFMYDGGNDSKLFRDPFDISIRNGIVSVPVEAPPAIAHPYVLLLPHKIMTASSQGALPDVWSQFDAYRDRALNFGTQIKWGPGLRFFLDPLARHIGLGGEAPFLVPDSTAFRLEWESFLARKYGTPEEARSKWAVMGQFKTFADLSRLVPLWAYGRGCPYFYDPQSRSAHRMIEGGASAANSLWWNDFQTCRDTSISYCLNTLADVLKRQVANVPVVCTWTPSGSFFTNYNKDGGFDGLAVSTQPAEPSRIARVFGPAYSQAEQSARTSWFLTSEIDAAPAAAPGAQSSPPAPSGAQISTVALTQPPTSASSSISSSMSAYQNRLAFGRDLDEMRRIGSKGFFVSSLQSDPASASASSGSADWIASPDSLAWLGEYATTFRNENGGTQRPHVLFYPQNAPGPAHTGLVPGASGVYWLPGAYSGESLDLWPFCWGYTIKRDAEEPASTVMVSLQGPQKAHFSVLNPAQIKAFTAAGAPVPVKTITKNIVEVTLNAEPLIIQFNSDLPPVPEEAASIVAVQLDTLFEIAKLRKVFGAENSRLALEQTKDFYQKKNFGQAYYYGRNELDKLSVDAAPYIWIEGEHDEQALFNEIAGHPEASQGAYRRLSTPNSPTDYGYNARYPFIAPRDGIYQIWLAGTLPGPNTSPIKWRINNEAERDIADPTPHGPLYMNERFGWILLGTAKLAKGEQKLVIDVTDRAAATHEYAFAIDAIMITDKPFAPNGTVRPLPVDDMAVRDFKKESQKLNPKPHYAP